MATQCALMMTSIAVRSLFELWAPYGADIVQFPYDPSHHMVEHRIIIGPYEAVLSRWEGRISQVHCMCT